jgi:hypothetical protein
MAETIKGAAVWVVKQCNMIEKFIDVSEEHTVSIFRVKVVLSKQKARSKQRDE